MDSARPPRADGVTAHRPRYSIDVVRKVNDSRARAVRRGPLVGIEFVERPDLADLALMMTFRGRVGTLRRTSQGGREQRQAAALRATGAHGGGRPEPRCWTYGSRLVPATTAGPHAGSRAQASGNQENAGSDRAHMHYRVSTAGLPATLICTVTFDRPLSIPGSQGVDTGYV